MGREVINDIPFVQAAHFNALSPGRHVQLIVLHSMATLKNSGWLCGQILIPKFRIPVQFLDADALKDAIENTDVKGFTTHAEVTRAFKTPGGHTDPGPNFPIDEYLTLVRQAVAGSL